MTPRTAPAPALGHYRSVAALSERMLDAARAGRWDELVAVEAECAAKVHALQALAAENAVRGDAGVNRERIDILRRILDHDAEIRALTQTGLRRLEHLLQHAGLDRRVRNAYGAGPAGPLSAH